ncbi:MAG: hypothetical protein KF708_02090 [Pirellulales bacterium]|nr:hypothetical protein [Pirellulales bacterium]
MHRVFSALVAGLLLFHVIAGCCWHHDHGGHAQGHGSDVACPAHATQCCTTHSDPPCDESSQHSPGHAPCEQPECVFGATTITRAIDDDSLSVVPPLVWLACEAPRVFAIEVQGVTHRFDSGGNLEVELPVRRHLLFSTLLI